MSNVGGGGGGINADDEYKEKTTIINPFRNYVVETYRSVRANKKLKALRKR
jgi:hypothetical protein